jgi:hypothetical protein
MPKKQLRRGLKSVRQSTGHSCACNSFCSSWLLPAAHGHNHCGAIKPIELTQIAQGILAAFRDFRAATPPFTTSVVLLICALANPCFYPPVFFWSVLIGIRYNKESAGHNQVKTMGTTFT